MEVGAVKQAFNNEVIQLKKNLNQARIQIIHKLTRKAKTFVEKKAPEKLKEKLKRKAESAVNEVLILKKIKPRDIARFIVTHTGTLQEYLNKPTVDQDKACARLLLHKSLQEKYKIIRNRFSGIPIKDLLMSRNERLKLKKEARLDQKMKKDKKQKVVNAVGDWDVENVNTSKKDIKKKTSRKFDDPEDDEEMEFGENADSGDEGANSEDEDANLGKENGNLDNESEDSDVLGGHNDEKDGSDHLEESDAESETKIESEEESGDDDKESDDEGKLGKFVKSSPTKDIKQTKIFSPAITFDQLGKNRRKPEMKPNKSKDMHKNKNLNEKLQSRKFKKESNESTVRETKIVDPFFITETGENYMSVAEPRQPDEVKEIHKQGNRKERRAAMFGYAPKLKPRHFKQNNSGKHSDSGFRNKNQANDGSYRGNDRFKNRNDAQFRDKNDKFRGRNDGQIDGGNDQFKGKNDRFNGRNDKFKGRNDQFKGRNDEFKGRNDSKFKGRSNDAVEPKVEKLHPSWEAKKKQSGILPFQGKKIVFDEG